MPLTLVALHGNGGGGFRFERTCPFFPADVNFVAPTLPGFAAKPRNPSLNSLEAYAAYIQHTIIPAHARPIVLLGHGIGGSIALEFGQHFPDAIDGLILHAPVGARLNQRWFPRLMALPGMRSLIQTLVAAPLMRPVFQRRLFMAPASIPSDYLTRFFAEYQHCTVFGQMFDLITAEWFATLQPIDLPTVLLWGEEERVLGVDQLNEYRRLLPQHTICRIPDWDHFPMIETPQAYANTIVSLARQLLLDTHASTL